MLNMKSFKDGERLVVVIEGLKNIEEEQEVLNRMFSGLISNAPDSSSSIEPPIIEDTSSVKEEVKKIIDEQQKTTTKKDDNQEVKTISLDMLKSRYKDCDAKEFASQLDGDKLNKFIRVAGNAFGEAERQVFTKKLKKGSFEEIFDDETAKKNAVFLILKALQK